MVRGIKLKLWGHARGDTDLAKKYCVHTTTTKTCTATATTNATTTASSIPEAKGIIVKLSGIFEGGVKLHWKTLCWFLVFKSRNSYVPETASSMKLKSSVHFEGDVEPTKWQYLHTTEYTLSSLISLGF
jgi:hypothetical protein